VVKIIAFLEIEQKLLISGLETYFGVVLMMGFNFFTKLSVDNGSFPVVWYCYGKRPGMPKGTV